MEIITCENGGFVVIKEDIVDLSGELPIVENKAFYFDTPEKAEVFANLCISEETALMYRESNSRKKIVKEILYG